MVNYNIYIHTHTHIILGDSLGVFSLLFLLLNETYTTIEFERKITKKK